MITLVEQDVLQEMESLGTEHNRKIYGRHGICDEMYGVSYADLKTLIKRIKTNHELALGLWASGNHDARVLATMIADPKKMTSDLADSWAMDLGNFVIADAFSTLMSKAPFALAKAEEWIGVEDEWRGAVGWQLMAYAAMQNRELPSSYFDKYLHIIESSIHSRKNRVRYAMNGALISIGMRAEELAGKALEVARTIGKVHVDHGETSCKTPNASQSIQKAGTRYKR